MIEPTIGAIVDYRYDLALVALSFLISVLGSYVALALAASARDKRHYTVAGPAVALGGCGIWAMHFIGMTAYKTALPISFSLLPTVLSLVIAISITGLGFRIALKAPKKFANLALGGAVIGGGVVAMHYLGMFGMALRASIDWDMSIVAASVAIAVVAATVALWLAFNVKTVAQRLIAALVMGVAVCAMHYTGMAAATLICVAQTAQSTFRIDGPYLGFLIFSFSMIALAFAIMYDKIGAAHAQPT